MIVYLVELLPALKTTGAIVALRYASSSAWTRANGQDWLPRLSVPYRRQLQVFDGAFSDQPQDYAAIEVRMQTGDLVSPVIGMAWDGRRARVWRGAPGLSVEQMQLVFDGDCDSVEATKQGFKVNLRGPGYKLTKPILSLSYSGSGDYNGTPDLANTPRPMCLGTPLGVSPVYVDKARGIFQYHGYGSGRLAGVYDGGSALTWDGKNYATYAELKAASVAGGYYATCDALGMGRHGGAEISVLTCDPFNCEGTAGGAIGSILTYLGTRAGVPVDAETMVWLVTNLPHPQDNYITDAALTYEAVARDMMLKLGGYVCWTADGRMSAGLVRRGGAATLTLGRQNLANVAVQKTAPPYFRRRMGYRRAWRLHSYGDTRTPKEVNPRGPYAAGTAYGYYDLVTQGVDSWLHVGEATTTGVPPAEGAVWTKFGVGVSKTSQLSDDAGLGLSALWPNVGDDAQGRKPKDYADQTIKNSAASITGQGSLATKNSLGLGSEYLTGFGSIAGLSSLGYGSNYLTGFGALSPLNNLFFGSNYLLEAAGGALATLNAFKTALGIASGFSGQGQLASMSSILYGSTYLAGLPRAISPSAFFPSGFMYASEIYGNDGNRNLDTYFPVTTGSDKTSGATSAGFSGQGALATKQYVKLGGADPSGSGLFTENGFGTSDASLITVQGTAAAFTGQTAWATFTTSTSVVSKFRSDGTLALGVGGGLASESFSEWVTNSSAITRFGTAAAFSGQGALATLSKVGTGEISAGAVTGSRIAPVDMSNLIPDAGLTERESWISGFGSPVYQIRAGTPGYAGNYIAVPPQSYEQQVVSRPTTVEPNSIYFASMLVVTTNADTYSRAHVTWYSDKDGVDYISDNIFGSSNLTYSGGKSNRATGKVVAPNGAKSVRLVYSRLAGGTGEGHFAEPILRRASSHELLTDDAVRLGSNVRRNNGTTLVGDADAITTLGTAAAIAGQGDLATKTHVLLGNPDSGDRYARLINQGGAYFISDAAAITSQGTAAAIAGQGQLATRSNIRLGGPSDAGFDNGAWAHLINQSNTYYVTDAAAITSQGTSSSFTGQTAWATLTTTTAVISKFRSDGTLALGAGGGLATEGFAAWVTNSSAITSLGTAAAIVGQSGFATASGLTRDQLFSAGFFNYNAFSLGYTVTRSDGISTVTESLVVTQQGIAAGFVNQGGLATKNKVPGDGYETTYTPEGWRVERDGYGSRLYDNNGNPRFRWGKW